MTQPAPSWLASPDSATALQQAILSGSVSTDLLCSVFEYAATHPLTPAVFHALFLTTRDYSHQINTAIAPLVDVCGTGGDHCNTINISTAIAPMIAASGIAVAKHGNRAASSRCGSSDVLQALGVDLTATSAIAQRQLSETKLTFLFAPHYHPSLRHVRDARKQYGKKTYFNQLGPLLNPMPLTHQIIGLSDPNDAVLMGYSLHQINRSNVVFVTGCQGEDEVSCAGDTRLQFLSDSGELTTRYCHPDELGLPTYSLDSIRGGTATDNAQLLRAIWQNTAPDSYKTACILNAAIAYHLVTKQPLIDCKAHMQSILESKKADSVFLACQRITGSKHPEDA